MSLNLENASDCNNLYLYTTSQSKKFMGIQICSHSYVKIASFLRSAEIFISVLSVARSVLEFYLYLILVDHFLFIQRHLSSLLFLRALRMAYVIE